jgi:DNA-binding XRE family transcriptional regulator
MSNRKAVNVINRLEELNLTRAQLANAAGVSERAVYHWFTYSREPRLTFEQMANVCNLLRWSVQELAEAYKPAEEYLAAEQSGKYDTN